MKRTFFLIVLVFLLTAGVAFAGYHYMNGGNSSGQKPTDISEASYDEAGVTFPIDNVKQSGKQITFTITENARELDEKADTVKISAMRKIDSDMPDTCPKVKSTSIDKDVGDYDMMSGKADVTATFATEEMARTAAEADCLLIEDTE